MIVRWYDTKPDEKKITAKLRKVAQDIWAQVQEKMKVEGLTVNQVNKWLSGLPIEENEDA